MEGGKTMLNTRFPFLEFDTLVNRSHLGEGKSWRNFQYFISVFRTKKLLYQRSIEDFALVGQLQTLQTILLAR